MNNTRRKDLKIIVNKIEELHKELNLILEQEKKYRDSIPENLQNRIKHERADDACYGLKMAVESLEDAFSSCAFLLKNKKTKGVNIK